MKEIFNEYQLDILKEVGNIGAGNSATALSQLINKQVNMVVPNVEILPYDEILMKIGHEEDVVLAVLLKAYGDAPGNILFIIRYENAQGMADLLTRNLEHDDVDSEIYLSAFQEIGNILGNSYLNAISQFTGLNVVASIPSLAIDMLGAILSACFIDANQTDNEVLSIDAEFTNDSMMSGVSFFFIPEPGSLEKIVNTLVEKYAK